MDNGSLICRIQSEGEEFDLPYQDWIVVCQFYTLESNWTQCLFGDCSSGKTQAGGSMSAFQFETSKSMASQYWCIFDKRMYLWHLSSRVDELYDATRLFDLFFNLESAEIFTRQRIFRGRWHRNSPLAARKGFFLFESVIYGMHL